MRDRASEALRVRADRLAEDIAKARQAGLSLMDLRLMRFAELELRSQADLIDEFAPTETEDAAK